LSAASAFLATITVKFCGLRKSASELSRATLLLVFADLTVNRTSQRSPTLFAASSGESGRATGGFSGGGVSFGRGGSLSGDTGNRGGAGTSSRRGFGAWGVPVGRDRRAVKQVATKTASISRAT
jgi:hypothetical protein